MTQWRPRAARLLRSNSKCQRLAELRSECSGQCSGVPRLWPRRTTTGQCWSIADDIGTANGAASKRLLAGRCDFGTRCMAEFSKPLFLTIASMASFLFAPQPLNVNCFPSGCRIFNLQQVRSPRTTELLLLILEPPPTCRQTPPTQILLDFASAGRDSSGSARTQASVIRQTARPARPLRMNVVIAEASRCWS